MITGYDQTTPSGNGTSANTVDTVLDATIRTLGGGHSVADRENVLTEFRTRSALLDQLQRRIARGEAVDYLTKLNVRGAAQIVDAAMQLTTDDDGATSGGGASIVLKDTEPWPDPVDGQELFDELTATILRYVAMPTKSALAVALWAVFTFAHDAFHISPILCITSPQRKCGKTTLMLLLGALVQRMLTASNMTAPTIFRGVDRFKPTLLLDEADTFIRASEELRGVLNSGHLRDAAFVIRCVGDDHEPKVFSIWGPKAIALIGKLPDTLQDRSILIAMRRRARGEKVKKLELARIHRNLEQLRRKEARWVNDNRAALATADPTVPSELGDRAADNWGPLLAIAERAGPLVLDTARKAALELAAVAGDDDTVTEVLLGDIRALFASRKVARLSSEDIVEALVKMEDRPWPEWGHQKKPLTKTGLAKLLKPFRIYPHSVRIGDKTPRGYDLEGFSDAFDRYLPPANATGATSQENRGKVAFSKCNKEADVALSKTGESSGKAEHVAGVALEDPVHGEGKAIETNAADSAAGKESQEEIWDFRFGPHPDQLSLQLHQPARAP